MGKGNKQAQSSTQTQITELPDYARPYVDNLLKRTEAESLNQYQPFQGQRLVDSESIADIADSRNMVRNIAGRGLPELDEAISGMRDISRRGAIPGAQLLEGIGKAQLGEQQAGLDMNYQDFLTQQNFNKDQLGFLSNILQGVPIQPNREISNFQNYNPLQQALGAGIAGLGLYRGMM